MPNVQRTPGQTPVNDFPESQDPAANEPCIIGGYPAADLGGWSAGSGSVESLSEDGERRSASRSRRYLARWRLRHFTQFKRFAGCGKWLNGSADGQVMIRIQEGTAHYSGLQSCGSVWSCPACAAKIRQHRADELEHAIDGWLAQGGGVEFVTLTVPHTLTDDLSTTFDRVAEGWRLGVVAGRWFRGVRTTFGIEGYCRTVEVTYGRNGWHPHIHALLFTRRPLSGRGRAGLGALMFRRWARWVERAGGGTCSPSAFRIVGGAQGAGAYLVKVQDRSGQVKRLGMEFTRGDLKTGRISSLTPFELIGPAHDGEAWALARWWEWEAVTKGRRCLTWSRGCRQLLGLNADEPTDEELAEVEIGGDLVLVLHPDTWRRVVGEAGAESGLLRATEAGGLAAAGAFLLDLRARAGP